MKTKQALSFKMLLIIGIVSLVLGYSVRMFAYETIGATFELFGFLILIFGIISFFRERKN